MFDIPYTEAAVQIFCNFIEIALQHGCSPVTLLHILRTSFLKNTSGRLLLLITIDYMWSFQLLWQIAREKKIVFSCTYCFMSTVVLAFALATALSKFRFRSPKNKTINLVLVVKYHFNCWLQQKSIFQGFSKILIMVSATTFCWVINCSWETFEFNKCKINLKM